MGFMICFNLLKSSLKHIFQVRLWDNRSGSTEPMKDFVVGGKVTSLDLSRDETKLAVCSRDDKILVI